MNFENPNHPPKLPRRAAGVSSCLLFIVLCIFTNASASPLNIQLVSEVTSIQPGKPFYVGLHLKHREHYHTYWMFPGIVGVPTNMTWELPPGWKAGPIEWPAPKRVMMFQIKAQGYHDEVLLPIKLTPPDALEAGTEVTLKGKAAWMCCGRDCNPDFADLSVTLPVDAAQASPDGRWQKMFATARADMPQPLVGFKATATRTNDRVLLRLTPTATGEVKANSPDLRQAIPQGTNLFARIFGAESTGKDVKPSPPASTPQPSLPGIFFTEDGYINADKDQVFRMEGNDLVIELIISTYYTDQPPSELCGILWLKDDLLGKGAIIRAPFAK